MYVYKFINSENEVIYIGKATNLKNRINSHNHLPEECYKERVKIQYIKLSNNDESAIYERYLINKLSPKYNVQYDNKSSFNFELPEKEWKDYNSEDFKLPRKYKEKIEKDYKDMTQKEKIKYHTNRGDVIVKFGRKMIIYKKEFVDKNKEDYINLYNSCYVYKNIEDVFSMLCCLNNKAIISKNGKPNKMGVLTFDGLSLHTKTAKAYIPIKCTPIIVYDKTNNYVIIYFNENYFIRMYFDETHFKDLENIINKKFEYIDIKYSDNKDNTFTYKYGWTDVIRDWREDYSYLVQ